jgi:hypothetical protein
VPCRHPAAANLKTFPHDRDVVDADGRRRALDHDIPISARLVVNATP